jgi:hypothetical protein
MAFSGKYCDSVGAPVGAWDAPPNIYEQIVPFPDQNFYLFFDDTDQYISAQIALFDNGYLYPEEWTNNDWCIVEDVSIISLCLQIYHVKKVIVPTLKIQATAYIHKLQFKDYFKIKEMYIGYETGKRYGI